MKKRTFIVLLGVLLSAVFANSALATAWSDPGGGYIEVCKAANPALTGQFKFTIDDTASKGGGTQTATIGLGTCTQPIPVIPGSVTVTENGSLTGLTNQGGLDPNPQTSFISATSTAVGPTGPLPSGTGFTYTTTVPASPGGSQNVVTVTFNDQLVTGVVEVCKSIVTGSGLTGSWQFTITGANGFSQVVSVNIGDCSAPITVPAGKVKVQETGDSAENVTAITATQTASNTNAIVGPNAGPAADLPTATVVAAVAAGDASKQTIVTMTNDSVRLKLCKYVDQGLTNTTAPGNSQFAFAFGPVTGNAGPNGPIAPLSLSAGNTFATAVCTVVGTFRAGTTVPITEGIIAGTKVGSINVNPTTNVGGGSTILTGSLSLPNRTVTVVLGAGETVVTYEDIPALKGTLKLCKVAGTSTPPVAPGTVFAFTVTPTSPAGSPQTVSVPAGQCVVVGAFAFDTTLSIVETALPNTTVQSITAVPTNVVVLEGGVATNTNQLVLTNTNTATRSTSVTIGENNITEVTYVNIDPPTDTGGGGTTGSGGGGTSSGGGGGSSSGGSSSGGGSSASSSSSSSTPATTSLPTTLSTIPTSVGVGLSIGGTSSTSKIATTKAAVLKAAKLAKLNKQLATIKATLKTLAKKHAAAKTLAGKHSLAKHITALKVSEAKLVKEIKALK